MNHVSILALNKALSTSIGIPLEMLSAANDIARSIGEPEKKIRINVVAQQQQSVSLAGGIKLHAQKQLADVPQTDLIFIPSFWGNPLVILRKHQQTLQWLAQQYNNGAMVCSVGTGSFLSAEAGLLTQRQATTHWYYFDQFQQRYPTVKLQRKRFITHDDNIYCTGSINAARDLMVYLLDRIFGEFIAGQVARHFTHELKRTYDSLLLAKDHHESHHDEVIIKIQEWLQLNFSSSINLTAVAGDFKMSIRSLNRRFKLAADKTPLQYLQELRVGEARELLKHSNLAIAEIAFRVGYQDASYFTSLFKKMNAVTPIEYRNLVRNKLFLAEA